MRFVTHLAALLGLLLAGASTASAHGGQYRGPGGRTPNDPTAPPTGPATTADWEAWWTANAWKYVNLRERLRARDSAEREHSGGGLGEIAGEAATSPAKEVLDPRRFYEDEVLPVVTAALQDGDAEVRSAAAVALGKMGYRRSLLDLRRAMRDEVRDVRDGAVLALGMLGEAFAADDLRAVLLDPRQPDRTRSFAAVGLGFLGADGAATLLSFLDPAADAAREGGIHRTPYTEASAITGLGFAGRKEAVEPLRRDYASAVRYEPAARSFCAVALARLGDRESIPFLLQGLDHPREPMRQSAALALGLLAGPADEAAVQALARRLFEEKDINTRQFALMSLSRIGGDPARAAVRRYLLKGERIDLPLAALATAIADDREMLHVVRRMFQEERQPSLKGGYALALGLFRDRDSAGDLRRLALNQGDRGLRGLCLMALGLMEDREAAPAVREVVEKENDVGVKMSAATCLGLLQDPAVVPLLERMVRGGENVYVRSSACSLLGNVGSPASAKVLIAVVKDVRDNSVVRMTATAGLGNLADRCLIPLLAQVSIDSNYAAAVDPLLEIATIL